MAMNRWALLLKHRWTDPRASHRAVPDAMAQRLSRRIAASEARHRGEVRVCVESALPSSDLWRVGPACPLDEVIRERALTWFGRLRVWDTEGNTGVLIYLLLAEHRIEIVADRGLSRHVAPAEWQAVVKRLGDRLRAGDWEDGLTQALEEVSALLMAHCPRDESTGPEHNELPDAVVRA